MFGDGCDFIVNDPVFQKLDVAFLVLDEASIAWVPDGDDELKPALLGQEAVIYLVDLDELVVPPALPDIEFGGVLSDHGVLAA